MFGWISRRKAENMSNLVNSAYSYNSRGRKFEVYDGPMAGKWIDYTGERFCADENGPIAQLYSDHEYVLRCDDYSNRLYYTWSLVLDPDNRY